MDWLVIGVLVMGVWLGCFVALLLVLLGLVWVLRRLHP